MIDSENMINTMLSTLFEGEQRRCRKELDDLISNNNVLKNAFYMGFTFGGNEYKLEGYGRLPPDSRPYLAYELCPQMDTYLADFYKMKLEEKQFRQILFKVTEGLETLQEFRDALPDCLVACSTYFPSMARQQPVGFPLMNSPRAMRQFLATIPRMEFYFATRLMY